MTAATLLGFLIGDREAILAIAANRHSLWIGLLFVLSASFAREYDGEDLLHEPWYLLIPLGASLASSLALFGVVYCVAALKGEPWRAFFWRYLSFLGLFWMTAPLAWLYAVPYERFLSPWQATAFNLATLALVALWRVVLMVRVVKVVLNYSWAAAVCAVVLFADGVALSLLNFLPFPLIDVMGGLHLTESERLTRNIAQQIFLWGGCSLPFWIIGAAFFLYRTPASWQPSEIVSTRPAMSLTGLAVASVLVWAAVLPLTQPEQQRRWAVERAYKRKQIGEMLALMSRHDRTDFPPHWHPPGPRVHSYSIDRRCVEFMTTLSETEVAPWVREYYFARLGEGLRLLWGGNEDELRRLGEVLKRTAEGRAVIADLEERQREGLVKRLKGE